MLGTPVGSRAIPGRRIANSPSSSPGSARGGGPPPYSEDAYEPGGAPYSDAGYAPPPLYSDGGYAPPPPLYSEGGYALGGPPGGMLGADWLEEKERTLCAYGLRAAYGEPICAGYGGWPSCGGYACCG
jgi:hypothetical protein